MLLFFIYCFIYKPGHLFSRMKCFAIVILGHFIAFYVSCVLLRSVRWLWNANCHSVYGWELLVISPHKLIVCKISWNGTSCLWYFVRELYAYCRSYESIPFQIIFTEYYCGVLVHNLLGKRGLTFANMFLTDHILYTPCPK